MANNTISLRSLLEKEKLNGINFLDWFRNLRIVLKQERKEYVIEEAVPNDPGPNASRADKDKFKKHMDDMVDVGCLMLATMTPELQKQHEKMVAYEMIQNLKEIYEGQARQERYETSKALFQCKMSEGSPVGAHVIKMMGYIQTLEKLGFALNDELATDVILQSLPDSFNQFVLNFNMNEINKTLPQLLGMLRTAESNMKKGGSKSVLMVRVAKEKGKKVAKSKGSGKTKPKGKEALKPKGGVSKDGKCFHCGKTGHWKRNCPIYLVDVKKAKAVGASVSGIYVIDVHVSTSSSWVLDTGCGSHICTSVQGLHTRRNLAKGDVDLRVGNGARVAALAVGTYVLSLPSGFQMANNTISLRSLLEKEKLNGINFLDWFRNLRIVLKQKRKEYVIEEAVPNDPGPNASRADKDKFKKHMDDMVDVGCLMLATMTPELQKQHENMVAYEMIQNLKEIYEGQARQERYETSKALFQCKMSEGSPVGAHVIKMMGYIQTLEKLGFALNDELATDVILQSLPDSFNQFVLNFNMNEINKTLPQLLGMLRTAESNMKKGGSKSVLMVRVAKEKGKKVAKSKGSDVKKAKAVGASVSGIYVIDVHVSTSSSWVLDTGCGSHICTSVQGLHMRRNLAKGDVDLRVGNGARVAALAVGTYVLSLPSGFQMANNTISLRSLLEKEKLNGINFLDWFRNLRIVLKQERKEYVIEEAVPNDPGPNASRADKHKFKKHMDDMVDVGCLMLATMTPELQKQHENMVAYEMIQNLKEIYEGQARQERYETSKALFQCKMSEGSPVGAHVIKMMGYIQTLEKLGFALNDELATDVILQSLPDSFNKFVLNFNMNEINKTLPQLLGMLRTAESNMKKGGSKSVLMVRVAKEKGKKVAKSKGSGKTKPKGKEALKPKGGVSKDGMCFHCGKTGHWKRNCPIYLEDVKKAKAVGASVSGTAHEKESS
ncbi:hypothetical protein V6N13_104873 [Hibiscus sabdariffa]